MRGKPAIVPIPDADISSTTEFKASVISKPPLESIEAVPLSPYGEHP